MADYDNTNSGVLFKNDRKESDRHPDYRGSINIEGEERWLSAWIKTGKNGKYMSLALGDLKVQKGQQSRPQQSPPADDFDDYIPF